MSGWSSAGHDPVTCENCGETWPRDPALEVVCPACHAAVGINCMRPSGHGAMGFHRARMQAAMDAGFERPCKAAVQPEQLQLPTAVP